MASTVGMLIKISADTKNAAGALNRIDGQMNTFSRNLKAIGFAMAGAFSVDKIVDFAREAVNLASAFEQAEGAALQLFGGPGAEKASEWARTTAANLGLSAVKALEAQNAIGAFARQADLAGEEAVAFTQDMVVAAADMAAAFGGDVQSAVQALGSAFRGEFNPIERYGIILKQSAIDAEAAALGYEKVGTSFSNQAKVLATTSLIEKQSQLLGIVGQNAREADTYAGATERLKAQFEDLTLVVGEGMLEGFGSVGDATGSFADSLEDLKPLASEVGRTLGSLASDVVYLSGKVADLTGYLDQNIGEVETFGIRWGVVFDFMRRSPIATFADGVRQLTGETKESVQATADAAAAQQALYAGYAANSVRAKQNRADVLKLGAAYETAAAAAREFLDSTGNRVLYNTVAAQVRGYNDVIRAAEEADKAQKNSAGAGGKAAEEATKKVRDLSLAWQYLGVEVDVAAKKAKESQVEAYNTQLTNLKNAAKAYTDTVKAAIAETEKKVQDYKASLNETFLGVNLDDFVSTNDDGTTIFDSAAFQKWLGDKEAIRAALSPVLDQIPQAWSEQILGMGNDAALATLNWITNSSSEVTELQRNMDDLATRTEQTLTGPMAEAMRNTFWDAQQEGIDAAKQKVAEEAKAFKKWVRSKLKTKITIDVEYREINSPPSAAAAGGAVRDIQQFEQLNGRSWRV